MEYLVTVQAKLFTVNRIVEAQSVAGAAAQVDQTGAVWVCVQVATVGE